jgi:hypothetical protein
VEYGLRRLESGYVGDEGDRWSVGQRRILRQSVG